jgi:hypothetical protein
MPENRKKPRLDYVQVASRMRSGLFIGNTAASVLHRVGWCVLALKPSGFVSPVTW